MSLVTWPWRKSLASEPVSASLPRPERSTTNVLVTHETLALFKACEPPRDLSRDLLEHALARDARLERRPHDRHLLRAVEPLQQGEQPFEVIRDRVGHVASSVQSCRLPKPSRRFSTRSRPTGRTWSSTSASRKHATSTPRPCS